MKKTNDPLAMALWDYYKGQLDSAIEVGSDVSLPETMDASYFFRSYSEMNPMERYAMDHASGQILDIGAGAGCHSLFLQEKGREVHCLESSASLSDLLVVQGLKHVINSKWQDWETDLKFDTILVLMNGIGMAETLESLPLFLLKLKSLLKDNGKILLDSSDITYLYELEDGSMIMDLGGSYPGEIVYTVTYKGEQASFPWLFVKAADLKSVCDSLGMHMEIVSELAESYLAEITILSTKTPSSSL